jgi:glucose/arabinose dehydrogenase
MKRLLLFASVFVLAACTSTPTSTATVLPSTAIATIVPPLTIAPIEPTPEPTQPPTLEPSPTAPAPGESRPAFSLGVEAIASGFTRPVYLTHAGDDRLFVVEQPGRVRVIQNGTLLETPFLDMVSLVNARANEQGLLSIAFHPDYASNGWFFVNYTRNPDGATVIARYRVSGDPNAADPNSAEVLLVIDQPERNHNGGLSLFGPDGYLYIGTGDGGGAGDRHGSIGNGQDPDSLLGKLLRLNVETGDVSIWSIGLRNPWRFSFDRATGDLYIGDVGQNTYEEIHFQPASSSGGENYGWRIMEGLHCFDPGEGCDQTGLTLPVAEYDHGSGCSVTGGYVYRGSAYPWLDGLYLFADYCTGLMWSLERDASGAWDMVEQMQVDFTISSFGEDAGGELYLVGHNNGAIYRLTSTSP